MTTSKTSAAEPKYSPTKIKTRKLFGNWEKYTRINPEKGVITNYHELIGVNQTTRKEGSFPKWNLKLPHYYHVINILKTIPCLTFKRERDGGETMI